jgi:predicted O-methyltransferase YrrM
MIATRMVAATRASTAGSLLRLMCHAFGRKTVPVSWVRPLRAVAGRSLEMTVSPTPVEGSTLRPSSLGNHLAGVVLGTWALGPRSLEEIIRLVSSRRPGLIVEFGSGASTVVLAWAMREASGPGSQPRVMSFEQDAKHAEHTRELLARAGLESECTILVAPMERQLIEERMTCCYAIPGGFSEVIGDRRIDLAIIDGPAGAAGVRFGTLPLMQPYLADGATFVLDDALRDGELAIAASWRQLSYLRIDGLLLIEKGLLVGRVTLN